MKKVLKVLKVFIIFVLIILLSCNCSFYSKVFAESEEKEKTIDDIFGEADAFLKKDNNDDVINDDVVKETSNFIYNILLAIGIVIAVITGLIIGIKFMTSTVEEKANIKKILVSYFIGCIILFSAFGIWSIVIGISNEISSIQETSANEYLASNGGEESNSKTVESKGSISEKNNESTSEKNAGSVSNNEKKESTSGVNKGSSSSKNNKISVSKITLNNTLAAIDTRLNKTVTLKTSIQPKNATDKQLVWEVTNGEQVVKVKQRKNNSPKSR